MRENQLPELPPEAKYRKETGWLQGAVFLYRLHVRPKPGEHRRYPASESIRGLLQVRLSPRLLKNAMFMQFLAAETIYCLIFCENEAVKVRKQRDAMA